MDDHTQSTCAGCHFPTTQSVTLTANGYYASIPSQVALVPHQHTRFQE